MARLLQSGCSMMKFCSVAPGRRHDASRSPRCRGEHADGSSSSGHSARSIGSRYRILRRERLSSSQQQLCAIRRQLRSTYWESRAFCRILMQTRFATSSTSLGGTRRATTRQIESRRANQSMSTGGSPLNRQSARTQRAEPLHAMRRCKPTGRPAPAHTNLINAFRSAAAW